MTGYCTGMDTERIRSHSRGHLYIAEWMEYRRLSDERLAGRLGVARETVTRWRKQQHRLNPEKIARLAIALDCKPEELWRPPPPAGRPSLDAMLEDATDDLHSMATDIVRRLAGQST